jgi:hypothetical protein
LEENVELAKSRIQNKPLQQTLFEDFSENESNPEKENI